MVYFSFLLCFLIAGLKLRKFYIKKYVNKKNIMEQQHTKFYKTFANKNKD